MQTVLTLSLFCAKQVIRNGPTKLNDLFWAVLDSGLQVGGLDEKCVLSGYLSRSKFLNYRRADHCWHIDIDEYEIAQQKAQDFNE